MGSGGYGGNPFDEGYAGGYEAYPPAEGGAYASEGFGYGAEGGEGFGYGYGGQGQTDYRSEVAALVPEGTPMLAAILIEQGILTQEGLGQVLARQAETGDALAHVLIDLELVAPDQLMGALQARAALR